jgi:hypothetical protein
VKDQCCQSFYNLFCKLFNYIIASFPIGPESGFQEIREKQKSEYDKKNENLDDDDQP